MKQASPGPNPRRVAMRTLREVEQREGFSNRILSAALERHAQLDRRDRGLITTLVYGVLRHRARLDRLIDAGADKPHKLKGELRMILRLASFEIVELERPLGIANAEAAKLVKRIDGRGRLARVVTAILHKVASDWQRLDAEAVAAGPVEALVGRWSIPRWLAKRWVAQLGPDQALARGEASAVPPDLDLRVDLHRASTQQLREALLEEQPKLRFIELPESVGDQPQCLRVRGAGDLFYGPSFGAGLISVQSLGSQQAVRALELRPGEAVLEACAGMGTKTVQLAEALERQGRILALDSSGERLATLEEQRERAALDTQGFELEVRELELGAGELAGIEAGSFDAVLIDAPCTGLGNLARHPELRATATSANIENRRGLQAKILRQCAAYLRPGGRLVYAVCSLEPEEGEEVVAHFLAGGDELAAHFELERSSAWTPEHHRCDGFWLARLRRRALS